MSWKQMSLRSQENFFNKKKQRVDPWKYLHHFSHVMLAAAQQTSLHPCLLDTLSSMEVFVFPHRHPWGFPFYCPKIASSHIANKEDQTPASVSPLVISLLAQASSNMLHTGVSPELGYDLRKRTIGGQMEGLCVCADSDPIVCRWDQGSFFL